MRTTIVPMLALLLVGGALGLGANSVRPKDRIQLKKNYFPVLPPADSGVPGPAGAKPLPPSGTTTGKGAGRENPPNAKPSTLNNPFTRVTLERMIELYQSSAYTHGEVVFVDARKDQPFLEGHIPGAIHIDRFDPDASEKARERLAAAESIVVYCGGGDCDDSIFLANDLHLERGIPKEKLGVFEGGMAEWEAENLETEEGDYQ